MKKLLFSSVLLLAANLLYGASMSSGLDDDHWFVFDNTEHGLKEEEGTPINSGYIWGEIGNAVTISNPFEEIFETRNIGKIIRVDNQIINVDYQFWGSNNPKDEEGRSPSLSLTVPISGSVLQLDVKKEGWAYVFFTCGSNKSYLVFEDGKAIGYTFAGTADAESVLGEVYQFTLTGGSDHNRLEDAGITSVESAQLEYLKVANPEAYETRPTNLISGFGVIRFAVKKNSTYLVCGSGTKMFFGAVYFTESEIGPIEVKKDDGTFITLLDPTNNGTYHKMAVTSTGKGSVVYNNYTTKEGTRSFNVLEGKEVVLNLVPVSGYKVDYIRVNGVDKTSELTENGTKLTIQGVTEQLTVDVNFVVAGEYATVTIGDTKHATFSFNKDLDFSSADEIKAYVASGFNHENGKILLMHVTEVPASTGLMVKGEAGSYIVPVKKTSYFYSNLFKPVLESTTIPEQSGDYTNYVLADGTEGLRFYRSDNASLSANKAYLQIPTSVLDSQNNARSLGISYVDDGHFTGIEENRANRVTNSVYNLNGQRVVNPKRGIYIKNGKKVVVSNLNNPE